MEGRDGTHTVPPTAPYGRVVSRPGTKKLLWMGEGASDPGDKSHIHGSRSGRRPANASQSRFHRSVDEAAFYFKSFSAA